MLLPKQSRNYVTGLAAACSLLLIACSSEEVRQVNLIPKPEQMTMTGGTFTVDSLALFGGQSSRNIKTVIDADVTPTLCRRRGPMCFDPG